MRAPATMSGVVLVAVAALVALVIAAPVVVPGQLGSLVETFRPWLPAVVPLLAAPAWRRRSRIAAVATLLPVAAWAAVFGPALLTADDPGPHHLTAVQHNVSDVNPDLPGTVRVLTADHPDFLGLEEVTQSGWATALAGRYPHHTVQGTVGLWSRHRLSEARLVDIRPAGVGADWNRALRAVAHTPHGDVAVYVAHLSSVRLDFDRRDESARKLGAEIAAEPLPRVLLLGDLNGTAGDRGLRPVSSRLGTAGEPFAFSWPAAAPIARIDQIMGRGIAVTGLRALGRTGSDHLPIAAAFTISSHS